MSQTRTLARTQIQRMYPRHASEILTSLARLAEVDDNGEWRRDHVSGTCPKTGVHMTFKRHGFLYKVTVNGYAHDDRDEHAFEELYFTLAKGE